jgi:hypothetical protein
VYPAKNILIGFLLLTTIAGGTLSYRQYQELITLRAAALDKNERADWQKRLWSAQKRSEELEQQVAAKKDSAERSPDYGLPPPPTGNTRRANFMAMMDKPEVQKLMAIQQKAALDQRYAQLFKALNLTPEQLEKFKGLLAEKQSSMMDVLAAARAQGINPRSDPETFHKLVEDAQAQIDDSIRSTLGDAAFDQYRSYEQTIPQRNTITQLEQRLSYSSTPLTDAQAQQLVGILASTGTTSNARMGGPFGGVNQMAGPSAQITDATIAQAQSVLTPQQVQALTDLQQEQQAQRQLAHTMRQQFENGGSTAPTPPPGG